MIRACIFDLDGTLADTLTTIANFANSALKAHGYEAIEEERSKKLVGNGRDVLIEKMLRLVGDTELNDFEKVKKTYDDLYSSDVIGTTKVFDGVKEVLTELKKRRMKIAVLSNKQHEIVPEVIKGLFGYGFFDACLGQMDTIPKKPAPDGAKLIADQFDIPCNEWLYVGDTGVDVETGKAAGMTTVGVLWGFRDKKELKKAGADYIIEKPEELLGIIEGENNK